MRGIALVTGATSGIGWELAKLLAKDGYELVLVARDKKRLSERAESLKREFNAESLVIAADLSDIKSPERIVGALKDVEVDVLVNNAGFGDYGPFAQSDVVKQHAMIEVNVAALTVLTRLLLPGMVARKQGKILNLASTAAFQPGPLMAVYYATKAYVLSFSEALAEELHDTGVTVTALCPGPTRSEFQEDSGIKRIRLVAGRSLATSAEVAKTGYRAMLAGKPLVIHGADNTLGAFFVRFLPRSWVRRGVHWLHGEAE
ncbi:SDR family oxidoreductase [Candidatus Berkelbacteria bacterium]|nr:SDR family oxidoreductase [Candidatus Berkelbacteria bacterium]